MLSYIIGAMEVQDVATADIPGTSLQTYFRKGDIHINIEGSMVTLLKYIKPDYYKYFIYIVIAAEINACIHNPRNISTVLS